jgi:hypothetical protein
MEPTMNVELQIEPEPVQTRAAIGLIVPRAGEVILTIFNEFGRQVEEVAHGRFPAGNHVITWDIGDLPSGTYYCQLQFGPRSATDSGSVMRKMIVVER